MKSAKILLLLVLFGACPRAQGDGAGARAGARAAAAASAAESFEKALGLNPKYYDAAERLKQSRQK